MPPFPAPQNASFHSKPSFLPKGNYRPKPNAMFAESYSPVSQLATAGLEIAMGLKCSLWKRTLGMLLWVDT